MLWRPGVREVAQETLYPFANMGVWFRRSVWTRARGFFSRAGYAVRIATLERDVARLQLEVAEAEALETENIRLRKLLDFSPPSFGRWQAAPVLSHGGAAAVWQSVRVGKGSLHGVSRGDPAVVPEGVVGRVVDVSPHTCEVMLITDPNSRIAAELELTGENVGSARGILYGGGATAGAKDISLTLLYVVEPLRLRYLDRDFAPPPRTRVVTSGLGRAFPKGLTIGWLLESRVEGNGLSREAEIAPAVDFSGLTEIFLLHHEQPARRGGS